MSYQNQLEDYIIEIVHKTQGNINRVTSSQYAEMGRLYYLSADKMLREEIMVDNPEFHRITEELFASIDVVSRLQCIDALYLSIARNCETQLDEIYYAIAEEAFPQEDENDDNHWDDQRERAKGLQ